jgi:RimK family alpha-L-glutamate ligase
LLTARPELEINRLFEHAALLRDLDMTTVDAARVVAISGSTSAIECGSQNFVDPPIDVALARVGNWRPESVLAALEILVAHNVATPNLPEAIRMGRDHWRTVQTLASHGLPVPRSIAGGDPEELARASASLSFPVVVKQRRSRMGIGVIKCDSRDHLESVLDSLWRLGDEVIVQQFVPTGGTSLRLMVVGGDVVAAARLTPHRDDWRSNAARGGSVEPYQPVRREIELAQAAADTLGLGVCGVDLLPGEETVICEVNPTPGFLRLEAATGVDVAGAIVSYAIRLGSRSTHG